MILPQSVTTKARDAAPDVRRLIAQAIEEHATFISGINSGIYNNPELAFHEKTAHDAIAKGFERLRDQHREFTDLKITKSAYGLTTCVHVEYSRGSAPDDRAVVFNAEYDALPKLGHACGHNLIASASVAAFTAAVSAMERTGSLGTVRLLGTPAEERGGGKIRLIRAGAYRDVDACLMVHPGPKLLPREEGEEEVRAVSVTGSLASQRVTAEFSGHAAHVGIAPWEGRNALDALVNAYNGISMMRQQLKPSMRVAGIITEGGTAANIVPDHTKAMFSIRAATRDELRDVRERVIGCLKSGAQAARCGVDIRCGGPYIDLRANRVLCERFTRSMNEFGHRTLDTVPELTDSPGAATDQGNVSYVCPAIMPYFPIDSGNAYNHSPGFKDAAGTEDALQRALECAKALAVVAYEVLTDDGLATEVWDEFRRDVGKHVSDALAAGADRPIAEDEGPFSEGEAIALGLCESCGDVGVED